MRTILLLIISVSLASHSDERIAPGACGESNSGIIHRAVWDSIIFVTRLNRSDFERLSRIEIMDDTGSTVHPGKTRCPARIVSTIDSSDGFVFYYEKSEDTTLHAWRYSTGAHYWREFVPFVFRIAAAKMQEDIQTNSLLRHEMAIAAKMRNRSPAIDSNRCLFKQPPLMLNSLSIIQASKYRSPESIARTLQRSSPTIENLKNFHATYHTVILEFWIDSLGQTHSPKIIHPSEIDKVFADALARAALDIKFPMVESGDTRIKYAIETKMVCPP